MNQGLKVLTVEVAVEKIFGGSISTWTLMRMARKGLIPCVRVGKRVLFSEEAIKEWAAAGGTALAKGESENPNKPINYDKIRRVDP